MPIEIHHIRSLQPKAKFVVFRVRNAGEVKYREYLVGSDPVTFRETWSEDKNVAQRFSGNFKPPAGALIEYVA